MENRPPSSLPNPQDISPDDCTLALIATAIEEQGTSLLKDRVIREERSSVVLDCKACPADLRLSAFVNVVGSHACRASFRQEASQKIIDSALNDSWTMQRR